MGRRTADERAVNLMRYFRIKNYERFQHYKSKQEQSAPTWIKLHRSLLSDYEFGQLSDISKAHLMLIWLLASQTKGRLPHDPRWVADKIGATSKVDLECLIAAGFLVLESNSESTLESSIENGSPLLSSPLSDLKELESLLTPQDLADGWNDLCAPMGLPKVEIISASRKQKAALRIREHPDIEFWNRVFGHMRVSPFLLGRANGNSADHKGWKASFDWLIENDTNSIKVYEGRYAKEN